MKLDRNVPGVSGEIGIGRENLQAVTDRDGADEQVRPGTLQASLTKAIIIPGGGFAEVPEHKPLRYSHYT